MSEKRPRKKYVKKVYARVERPQRERRERKIVETYDAEHLTWTVKEKELLLEALYFHSPLAVDSIANIIGTKTPKQVEDLIEKTVEASCNTPKQRKIYVDSDPDKTAAPLELWLALVQELIHRDKKEDHSVIFSKAMRVIARNEPMAEDHGIPNLNWRNLYHFMSDLLGDKADVQIQSLSKMESLVMLDMMHSLGDTLHTSDTQEQRKLLDLKYQLFQWEKTNPSDYFTAGLKAHKNDFTGVDVASSSSSSATKTPASSSASSTNIHLVSSDQTPGPSHPKDLHLQNLAPSTYSSSHFLPTKSATDNQGGSSISLQIHGTSSSSSTSASMSSTSGQPQSDFQTPTTLTEDNQRNQTQIPVPIPATSLLKSLQPNPSTSSNVSNTNKSSVSNKESGSVFSLPKLFSLNPLTIPPSLLELKPKYDEIVDEIPVVIDYKDN